MRKIFKLGLVFVFLATGVFVLCFSSRSSGVLPSSEAAVVDSAPVQKLYLNNCARCHGADGKSQTALGKQTDATDLTDSFVKKMSRKRVTNVITNGADGMPAFGKKLSKTEISSLVNYIRGL